jgi:hypothetical protein
VRIVFVGDVANPSKQLEHVEGMKGCYVVSNCGDCWLLNAFGLIRGPKTRDRGKSRTSSKGRSSDFGGGMLRGEVIPSLAVHSLGLGCEEKEPSRRLKDYIPLKCCCSLVPTTRHNSAIPPRLPGVLYTKS